MHTDKPLKPVTDQPPSQKRLARQNVPDPIREKEARLLKAKYLAAKKLDPSLNQEKIADICGWAGQSVVSQYLNAKIPLNLSALVKFAGILNFDPSEVSPRLTESHPGMEVEHLYPKSLSGPRWDNLVISSREENNALRMAPFDLRGDNAAGKAKWPCPSSAKLSFPRDKELWSCLI